MSLRIIGEVHGRPGRRRLKIAFRLGLSLLAVAAMVSLCHPGVYWPVTGWLKGEPFYQNRPTRYWKQAVQDYVHLEFGVRLRPLTLGEKVLSTLGVRLPSGWDRPPVLDGDPAALPVLIDLLKDENPSIRVAALIAFQRIALTRSDARATGLIPILVNLLNDSNVGNANESPFLWRGPGPIQVREVAIRVLGTMGPETKEAVPAIMVILKGEDQDIRGQAAIALRQIDPDRARQVGLE
jgi:hypothetical protein